MTIDELLTMARRWLATAEDKETTLEEAAQCATIAQAAAQTAQAIAMVKIAQAVSHDGFQPALRVVGDVTTQH